nr:hypothetical protein Iba_chr01bCG18960 [Ipomoea batatas]
MEPEPISFITPPNWKIKEITNEFAFQSDHKSKKEPESGINGITDERPFNFFSLPITVKLLKRRATVNTAARQWSSAPTLLEVEPLPSAGGYRTAACRSPDVARSIVQTVEQLGSPRNEKLTIPWNNHQSAEPLL